MFFAHDTIRELAVLYSGVIFYKIACETMIKAHFLHLSFCVQLSRDVVNKYPMLLECGSTAHY